MPLKSLVDALSGELDRADAQSLLGAAETLEESAYTFTSTIREALERGDDSVTVDEIALDLLSDALASMAMIAGVKGG